MRSGMNKKREMDMAGDWIKMRKDLLTSPKVVRIASALGADRLRVTGGLFAVWCLFDTHSADGILEGYTTAAVDDLIGFPGFSAAMVSVGWLIEEAGSLAVPAFEDHNGQSAKRRAQEADRKREVRKASASGADKKRTREEKRREENNNSAPDKPAASLRAADLVELGVDEQIAKDFLATRKAKKAPLTRTALAGLQHQADLAGVTLSQALAICTLRGWQGFKADWLTGGQMQAVAPVTEPASPYRRLS